MRTLGEQTTAARQVLRDVFGFDEFRSGQEAAIGALLSGRSVLTVMPTGSGKSLCFQIPALITDGLTVVVSPLVALMQDQVAALRLAGVATDSINSANGRADNIAAWRRAAAGETQLLYMAPERLMTEPMLASLARLPVKLFAIDEAHCISQWGPAFRPEYEDLCGLRDLFPGVPIAALTATADEVTREDIAKRLFGGSVESFVLGFDRPNIKLSVEMKRDWKGQLRDFIARHEGESGIVYCLSRKKTAQGALEETLDGLFAQAERELAGLPDEAREGKALRSLINHREGLSVFVDRPLVPMDNNLAERMLRGPAIGRRLSFGSDSETGARFTAMMYSVVGTLALNGIDVLRWLEAWLEEWPSTAGRPVALAAMVDERGTQARPDGAGMTGAVECRYYGRDFTAEEMALLRALIAGPPALNRHRLSKAFCRRIGWFKPDGGLKDMMARVTMLAMHRDGLIVLPPKQGRQNRPKPIVFGLDTEPPLFPTPTTLDEVRPLTLRPVVRGTREGKLWNEFIARYHYLGYRTLVGAQMRYAVHDRDGWPVAMLGFSTAAWKLAPRDTFIGWTPQLREKNLPLMVDNPRFLILPWINIPNLGSHILAIIRRRLPEDWTERYNTTPVLIKTFVETPRYTGAVYRASGWIHVGATKGRGRYDRDKLYDKPRKDIWLRPLRRDWKRTLNR